MSDDKKKGDGNGGNGNGSGHRVIQFTPPQSQQQQPQQPPKPPKKMGSASVIAKLKELLATAETGRFDTMIFIGVTTGGDITLSWSNIDAVKGKIYLTGALDVAKATLLTEVFQTAKRGIGQ